MNIQSWFPLGLIGLVSLHQRESEESCPTPQFKSTNLQCSTFFMVHISHVYITTGKAIALTIRTFVSKVTALLLKSLSKFILAFLPRSKCLLISWLQSPSAVILEPKKINSVTVSFVSPSICQEVMGADAMIFVFWMLSFKRAFSLSSFTLIKRLLVLLAFCHKGGVICISEVIDISPGNLDSSLCFIWPSILHGVLCTIALISHASKIMLKIF